MTNIDFKIAALIITIGLVSGLGMYTISYYLFLDPNGDIQKIYNKRYDCMQDYEIFKGETVEEKIDNCIKSNEYKEKMLPQFKGMALFVSIGASVMWFVLVGTFGKDIWLKDNKGFKKNGSR